MDHNSLYENPAMPDEYRKIAKTLFPPEWFSSGQEPAPATLTDFAKALGIDTEYQRFLEVEKNAEEMGTFLRHFQNNLDLLIQKTWVEKADVSRKEKLQDEIPSLITLIVQEDFQLAIEQFGAILKELAYLFFGTQSIQDDFTEYTFRIDAQIGLFWWYSSQLGSLKKNNKISFPHDKSLWAILLIGICYLTNF